MYECAFFPGTGTPVGDPIEANSLGTFFGTDGSRRFIGSVKTNIGHLESAAGIAGLIKVLLMMKNGTIVPSLHFSSPNPLIDFDKYNFKVPDQCYPWERLPDNRRIACVNSFGFGGSNAHAVIIQQPDISTESNEETTGHPIIAVSGHSKPALRENVKYLMKIVSESNLNSRILSYTSTCRRDHYPHRTAVSVRDGENLSQKLQSLSLDGIERKRANIIFVFGGMGTSWDGMFQQLMKEEETFLNAVRDIDKILGTFSNISLEDELQRQDKLFDPMVGPLLLFAGQVGLFSVWKSWGVEPNAVVGQSVGEVAAAFASGRINLEDAVKIIYHRTELLCQVTGGHMLVILNCQVSEVEKLCAQYDGRVNIAVYYSPRACSVSGDQDCVDNIRKALEENHKDSEDKISVIPLKVTTAFHSQRMESLMKPLIERLADITSREEEIQIYSSVSGKLAEEGDFVTPEYWANNLRQSVLFYQAVKESHGDSDRTIFIEIGPKPVLRAHLDDIFDEEEEVKVISSIEKGSDIKCMLNSLCRLYSLGVNPVWENIVPQVRGKLTDEPKYQFRRAKLLYEPDNSKRHREGITRAVYDHPFIIRMAGDIPTFKVGINERDTPFIFQHVVNGTIVVPGAFYTEVALAVGYEVLRIPPQTMTISAHYIQPMSVQKGKDYFLICQVKHVTSTRLSYVVYKQKTIFAHGHIEKRKQKGSMVAPVLSKIKHRCHIKKQKSEVYDMLDFRGFRYGDGLAIVSDSYANQRECLSTIETSELVNSQMYRTHFHPSVLDAMTQALCTIVGDAKTMEEIRMEQVLPAGLGSVSMYQSLEKKMLSYAKVVSMSRSKFFYNMVLMTTTGTLIAEVKDMCVKVVGRNSDEVDRVGYSLTWKPISIGEPGVSDIERNILVISDCQGLANAITNSESNVSCVPYHRTVDKFDIEEVKKSIQALKSEEDEKRAVVFGQGSTVDGLSAKDLFTSICKSCDNLRQLLVFLAEEEYSLPVAIVTRSTQTPSFECNEERNINIFGSQFWGMVRCMVKEDLYPFVQLIDISDDSSETMSVLVDVVTNQLSSVGKEIMISDGVIHESTVEFSREISPSTPSVLQNWNGCDSVSLVNADTHSSSQSEVYLQYSDINDELDPENMKVSLETILLHEETFFPVTKASEMEVWSDTNEESSKIITLEAVGRAADSKEPVVVCLPLEVSNEVFVPRQCVIPVSSVPCYHTGILTFLSLLWKVHENLSRRRHTIIITEESSYYNEGKLVQDILSLWGLKRLSLCPKTHAHHINITGPSNLLLLADLDEAVIGKMLSNPHLKGIISIKGCKGDTTSQSCFGKDGALETVRVNPKQVYKFSNMKKILPKIVHFLNKKKKKIRRIFEGLGNNHFRNFSKGSLSLQNNQDVKLLVKPENLFRPNASYLVVGGLGGLGWLTVCLIAEMGGGLVATVSRKPPSEEMQSKIKDLKKNTGVKIVCLQADISDQASLAKALNVLHKNFKKFPLRGIFQGAGILDDAFLMRMQKGNFDRVCMPKILGTYNLHELTKSLHLDYFVMHSSIVSIAGNPGQSNYGAGNSFMDTFAHYRRSQGLAGQSINWGPLELGMALNNEQIAQQLARFGFVSLNEEQIRNCLVHTLLTNTPQICFMDFDWVDKYRFLYLSPDIRPIILTGGRELDEEEAVAVHIDLELLRLKSPEERFKDLFDYLKNVIAQVLNVDVDEVTLKTSVVSLGLDSMLAMTMVNQIKKDLAVRMSLVKLLEDSSVETLVMYLDSAIMSDADGKDDVEAFMEDADGSKMSVLETMAYDLHSKWGGSKDLVFGAEIHITITAPIEWMRDLLILLIGRHQSLRTIYRKTENGVEPVILSDLSDLNIIELEPSDPGNLKKEIFDLSRGGFDLSSQLPVRIICSHKKENYMLGFIFHPICFDLKAIDLFFVDFKEIALAKSNGLDLPAPRHINVAAEMRATLMPKLTPLQVFWELQFRGKADIPLISFSKQTVKPEILCGYHDTVSKQIPDNLQKAIEKQMHLWKVTLFQFVISAYQLLLHLASGENTLAVRTSHDTRMHSPALKNVISRCVNVIPLLASFGPKDSIHSFVASNSKNISECVENGMFPFKFITENCSEEVAANLSRHSVIYADLSGLASSGKGLEQFQFEFKSHGPMKIGYETRLLLWSKRDSETHTLRLDYLPELVSSSDGNAILESLFALLDFMVTEPNSLIEEIPDNLLTVTAQSFHYAAEQTTSVNDTQSSNKLEDVSNEDEIAKNNNKNNQMADNVKNEINNLHKENGVQNSKAINSANEDSKTSSESQMKSAKWGFNFGNGKIDKTGSMIFDGKPLSPVLFFHTIFKATSAAYIYAIINLVIFITRYKF